MTAKIAKDIWVIGFPKSGNTWISYLCSYCLNLPFYNYGKPQEDQKRKWVKELTSGGHSWAKLDGYGSVQKTHHNPDRVPVNSGLVMYVIRDPRDVFVSYQFFMSSKHTRLPGKLRYLLLGLLGKGTQRRWFLNQWKTHLENWRQRTDVVLSYDRLLQEGPDYLLSIFAAAPFHVPGDIVRKAYETFSFTNLSGGRAPGTEDMDSFFRKGVSGDWRKHLSNEDVGIFEEAVAMYREVTG